MSLGRTRLIDVIKTPGHLLTIGERDWASLIEDAEAARLLGRFLAEVDATVAGPPAAPWLGDRLASARAFARECERAVAWEVRRLARAFHGCPWPWILLKGAAYVAAGLPPAAGRRVADIDVLVPVDALGPAAAALEQHGWHPLDLSDYDRRYYNEWMHELPPMVHEIRGSVIDLHHAILPRTSRLQADPAALFAHAVPRGSAHVLSPTHMVLHAAVHLFHDGEIAGATRDLVDLDDLLRHFGTVDAGFWRALINDSTDLGLDRPMFYSLRYTSRLLETPIPRVVFEAFDRAAPNRPVLALMDALVERTLGGFDSSGGELAAFGLFVRSHWLRMPPLLLARHLAHKLVGR